MKPKHFNAVAAAWIACLVIFATPVLVFADAPQSGPDYTVNTTNAAGDGICTQDECTWREAITAANSDEVASTINLQAGVYYELADSVDSSYGASALPSVTTPITLHGSGATIERSLPNVLSFRLFHVASGGSLTIDHARLEHGDAAGATGWGGAIYSAGTLTLQSVDFFGNYASQAGGAVYLAPGATANLTAVTFDMDNATAGGSLGVETGATATLAFSSVSHCSCDLAGACIYNSGTLTIDHSTLQYGQSLSDGGGIYNSGTLTIQDSVLSELRSEARGGALFSDGPITIIRSDITMNHADLGGGIYLLNTALEMIDTTVYANVAESESGGGLLNASSTATIRRSAFLSNTAVRHGGGIFNTGSAVLNVTNVNLSTNRANENGGGIYNYAGSVHLNFVTLTSNRANYDLNQPSYDKGGGIYNRSGGVVDINNSILYFNETPYGSSPETYGEITTLDYNLFGNSAGMNPAPIFGSHDLLNLNPLLETSNLNGGRTPNRALIAGSPALDVIPTGVNGCGGPIWEDQRAYRRPRDGNADGTNGCDIGSYEAPLEPLLLPYHTYMPLLAR